LTRGHRDAQLVVVRDRQIVERQHVDVHELFG
jgi:hypothetical protein